MSIHQNGKPDSTSWMQSVGTIAPYTDMENAAAFSHDHADNVRYCHPQKTWYVWTGRRWERDAGGRVERLAKQTVARQYDRVIRAVDQIKAGGVSGDAATAAGKEIAARLKWAARSQQADKIGAMLALARSEPGIPVSPDKFDSDPWLLNVRNGTVDLRTGKLQPHRREDYLSKICPTEYHADAGCSGWQTFLGRVFGGDDQTVQFVQRLLGYCLTGDTSMHVLPVFYGAGSNGKSTLVEVVQAVIGADFAAPAAPDILLAKHGGGHPTELADLHGRRAVVVSEIGEGRRFDEATVKRLTGGDTIKARGMREDFWSFAPSHKFLVCTNTKPDVRKGGNAFWRRLRLIPFGVKFWKADEGETGPPELEADRGLHARLVGVEAAGILAWMVRGCVDWLAAGRELGSPPAVAEATREYRDAEDLVRRFVQSRCEFRRGHRETAKNLYETFARWCDAEGEENVPKRKPFGESLIEYGTNKGLRKLKASVVVYENIRILAADETPEPESDGSVGGTGPTSASTPYTRIRPESLYANCDPSSHGPIRTSGPSSPGVSSEPLDPDRRHGGYGGTSADRDRRTAGSAPRRDGHHQPPSPRGTSGSRYGVGFLEGRQEGGDDPDSDSFDEADVPTVYDRDDAA